MIKHEGDKWVLYTKDGARKLGEHDTEAEAQAQERAIEASKHRAAERAEQYRALMTEIRYDPRVLAYEGAHPFTHCMEVVVPAMAEQGKEPDDPEAFCAWWKMEHAEARSAMRHLHLVGCASKAVVKSENGVEYIVVPVVALMEGVIHAINAETPEFVPLSTLKDAAETWNGKPVTLGHPVKNGKQCSAQQPDIIESHGMGVIRNSHMVGTKLHQEAWVEKNKVKRLHPEMHDRLLDAKNEEVSVGAHVIVHERDGEHGGKKYKRTWVRAAGDHLAFLPGGRGACSIEMGCGAHRAASHFIAAQQFVTLDDISPELVRAFIAAAGARHSSGDMAMIQGIHDHACKLGAKCDRENYETLSEPRIRLEGGRWVLYSSDGKRRLASHDTEAEARAQEQAIEAAQHRRSRELQGTN